MSVEHTRSWASLPVYPILCAPAQVRAPMLVDVIDGANFGDGRDLSVTFRVQGADPRVFEFRVFVARSATLPSGDPPTSGPFHVVAKAIGDVQASLVSSSADIDGTPIEEGRAYVLCAQAWTGSDETSATSSTSLEITLARTNVVQTVAQIDAGTGGGGSYHTLGRDWMTLGRLPLDPMVVQTGG